MSQFARASAPRKGPSREVVNQVVEALRKEPKEVWTVLVSHYSHGLSDAEIGERLGKEPSEIAEMRASFRRKVLPKSVSASAA